MVFPNLRIHFSNKCLIKAIQESLDRVSTVSSPSKMVPKWVFRLSFVDIFMYYFRYFSNALYTSLFFSLNNITAIDSNWSINDYSQSFINRVMAATESALTRLDTPPSPANTH